MNSYSKLILTFVIPCSLLMLATSALATPFSLVSNTAVSPPPPGTGIHGIARVGDQWFMANFDSGWNVYDLSFNQVGTTTTDVPTGETRGLVYDPNSGNVFIGDIHSGTIHEVTTAGTVINSFSSTVTETNALAFNPANNHLFALSFAGQVNELTRTGDLVGGFVATGNWTGAAYDAVNNTLLLLESSTDFVWEYSTGGVVIDTPLSENAVPGNGQGLHYDSASGVLHVTSQYGEIAIWERSVPGAIEGATWGSIKSMFGNDLR